jgi:hypothetical protein
MPLHLNTHSALDWLHSNPKSLAWAARRQAPPPPAQRQGTRGRRDPPTQSVISPRVQTPRAPAPPCFRHLAPSERRPARLTTLHWTPGHVSATPRVTVSHPGRSSRAPGCKVLGSRGLSDTVRPLRQELTSRQASPGAPLARCHPNGKSPSSFPVESDPNHRTRLLGARHLPDAGPMPLVGNHGLWGYETPAFSHLLHRATGRYAQGLAGVKTVLAAPARARAPVHLISPLAMPRRLKDILAAPYAGGARAPA